jgi:H+/Cl- antiporter ClcA
MQIPRGFVRLAKAHHRERFIRAMAERWRRRALFIFGGVAVGAAAAVLAQMANIAQSRFTLLTSHSHWLVWLIVPAGFGTSTYIAQRWFNNSQGSGIPQTIAAHLTSNTAWRLQLISLRTAVGKMFLTILGLLCGASTGREARRYKLAHPLCSARADWLRAIDPH